MTASATTATGKRAKEKSRKKPVWREYGEALLVAGILALIIAGWKYAALYHSSSLGSHTRAVGERFVSKPSARR